MLDKWITTLLDPQLAPDVLARELKRLQDGGYLSTEEVEQLLSEASAQMIAGAERTRAAVLPLIEAAGKAVRGALDLPSRSEVVALTEALRERQDDAAGEP